MADLFASPAQIGFIILRTLVVYLLILVGFRVAGKREVGQLAPFDFALILLIANAVQNAMVGPDTSLTGGLAAACVLLTANFALGRLVTHNKKVERLLRGRARLLVRHGKVDAAALHEERISHEDLLQALRESGCPSIDCCRLAVLETDGTISVIEEHTKPTGS
jgi:uncharacterized membrane protein YcaP (DUF421 family)